VVDHERATPGEKGSEPPRGETEHGRTIIRLRDRAPAAIRDASFPVAMRGYDRRAVDEYVARVNHVIAELEVSRSPQAAVRNALERVSEQTSGLLREAREAAEEIAATAQEEAEGSIAHAKAEAAEIVVNASTEADATKAEAEEILARAKAEAETTLADARAEAAEQLAQAKNEVARLREEAAAWVRELHADNEAVQNERLAKIDDIRGMAKRLEELAGAAARRFPSEEADELEAQAGAPTEELKVANPTPDEKPA
jgi:DivIVA domain-containing protein